MNLMSQDFLDSSPFWVEFTIDGVNYKIGAPNTPGVGHNIIAVKDVPEGWDFYYGPGRGINWQSVLQQARWVEPTVPKWNGFEFTDTDVDEALLIFIRVHLRELNLALAADHSGEVPDANSEAGLMLRLESVLMSLFITGNQVSVDR